MVHSVFGIWPVLRTRGLAGEGGARQSKIAPGEAGMYAQCKHNHHFQVRFSMPPASKSLDGISRRLTLSYKAVDQELKEPVHSEAHDSGRYVCVWHLRAMCPPAVHFSHSARLQAPVQVVTKHFRIIGGEAPKKRRSWITAVQQAK